MDRQEQSWPIYIKPVFNNHRTAKGAEILMYGNRIPQPAYCSASQCMKQLFQNGLSLLHRSEDDFGPCKRAYGNGSRDVCYFIPAANSLGYHVYCSIPFIKTKGGSGYISLLDLIGQFDQMDTGYGVLVFKKVPGENYPAALPTAEKGSYLKEKILDAMKVFVPHFEDGRYKEFYIDRETQLDLLDRSSNEKQALSVSAAVIGSIHFLWNLMDMKGRICLRQIEQKIKQNGAVDKKQAELIKVYLQTMTGKMASVDEVRKAMETADTPSLSAEDTTRQYWSLTAGKTDPSPDAVTVGSHLERHVGNAEKSPIRPDKSRKRSNNTEQQLQEALCSPVFCEIQSLQKELQLASQPWIQMAEGISKMAAPLDQNMARLSGIVSAATQNIPVFHTDAISNLGLGYTISAVGSLNPQMAKTMSDVVGLIGGSVNTFAPAQLSPLAQLSFGALAGYSGHVNLLKGQGVGLNHLESGVAGKHEAFGQVLRRTGHPPKHL